MVQPSGNWSRRSLCGMPYPLSPRSPSLSTLLQMWASGGRLHLAIGGRPASAAASSNSTAYVHPPSIIMAQLFLSRFAGEAAGLTGYEQAAAVLIFVNFVLAICAR